MVLQLEKTAKNRYGYIFLLVCISVLSGYMTLYGENKMSHPIDEKNSLEYIRVYIKLLIDGLTQSPKTPQRLMNRIDGVIKYAIENSDTPDSNVLKNLNSAKISKSIDSTIHFLERALTDIEEKQRINNEVFKVLFKIISYFVSPTMKTATSFTIDVCASDTKKGTEFITLAVKYGYLDFFAPDNDTMFVTPKGMELYQSLNNEIEKNAT